MNQWLTDSDKLREWASAAGRAVTWRDRVRVHGSELTGVAGSVICLLVFGPDIFIVPSMALVLIALTAFRKKLDPDAIEGELAGAGLGAAEGSSAGAGLDAAEVDVLDSAEGAGLGAAKDAACAERGNEE